MIPSGHNQTTRKGCVWWSCPCQWEQCMVLVDLQAGKRTSEWACFSVSFCTCHWSCTLFHNTMLWKLNQLTSALLILIVFVMNQLIAASWQLELTNLSYGWRLWLALIHLMFLLSLLVLQNINLHAGIMHTCQTPNTRIHEHFKTFPEESLLPDTLPPLNGTNPWLDSYNTRICTNCYTPSPLTDQSWWQESPKSTLYFAAASRKGMWTKWKPISAIYITRIMETAEVPCMLQCGEPLPNWRLNWLN